MSDLLILGDETCRICRRTAGPVCQDCIEKHKLKTRKCAGCDKVFVGSPTQMYCDIGCRKAAKFERKMGLRDSDRIDISEEEIERRFQAAKRAIAERRRQEQQNNRLSWWNTQNS